MIAGPNHIVLHDAMNIIDEPVPGIEWSPAPAVDNPSPELGERIGRLLASQPFAVLCTQGGGQAYGALVGFAYAPCLTALAFSTPITTRKYRLLEASSQVALVVDSRSRHPDDMMQVEAVTVTGRAMRLAEDQARGEWASQIGVRHPYLRDFLKAPTTAVFRVDVCRYFYVARFQEVTQWVPGPTG